MIMGGCQQCPPGFYIKKNKNGEKYCDRCEVLPFNCRYVEREGEGEGGGERGECSFECEELWWEVVVEMVGIVNIVVVWIVAFYYLYEKTKS